MGLRRDLARATAVVAALAAPAFAVGCGARVGPPQAETPTTAVAHGNLRGGAARRLEVPARAAAATCSRPALQAALDVQPRTGVQPLDRVRALLVLTNAGRSPCRIRGFSTLDAASGGKVVAVPAHHVDQPSVPRPVQLAAGVSAFAGVEWSQAATCATVRTLSLRWPRATSAGEVPVHLDMTEAAASPAGPGRLCRSAVEVGPWVATVVGAVAFPDAEGPGLADCADVGGSLDVVDIADGTATGRLVVDDLGDPCVLPTRPPLDLVASGGRLAPAPVATSATVEISSGVPAWATVRFTSVVAPASVRLLGPCLGVARSVDLQLPGGTGSLAVRGAPATLCAGEAPLVASLAAGAGP